MGIFSRGRRHHPDEPSADGPRDAELTMLSQDQAAALFRMVREEVARRGREAAVLDGRLTLDGGERLGLHNLATFVAHEPFSAWRPLVANHVRVLVEDLERPREVADSRQVFVRLVALEDLESPPDYDAWSPLPGIVAVVAIDHPEQVTHLLRGLDEVNGDLDSAYANALANLAALPPPHHEVVGGDQTPGADIHVFAADDFVGASRMLVLGQVLENAGVPFPDHGVLIVVPNRHVFAVHVPVDESIVAATEMLSNLAMHQSDGQPGPISPHVFHLRPDGVATQFSSIEGSAVTLTVEGPIAEMFEKLGLTEG